MHRTLLQPASGGGPAPRNWIAHVAVGQAHLAEWEQHARDSVIAYAERHGLGVVVFTDHLDEREDRKHPAWQKLLVGRAFGDVDPGAHGILVLDTDVVANPWTGLDVFAAWNPERIGMVSQRVGMPYGYEEAAKRVCFLRNRFVSPSYPLDSSFLYSVEDVYRHDGLAPVGDECCSGFLVFNLAKHGEFLAGVYERYRTLGETLALEQTHLNYHVQESGFFQRMDYHFQVLWVFEMATKYPFLYRPEFRSQDALVRECVGASLLSSTFLHFAGRWNESGTMQFGCGFLRDGWEKSLEDFAGYLRRDVKGVARGMINPPDAHFTRNRPE